MLGRVTLTSPEPRGLVLRSVRLALEPQRDPVDVTITADRVTAVEPAGERRADSSTQVVDCDGRYVVPGLWDHHVHFTQWALRRQRLDLASTTSAEDVVRAVERHQGDQDGRGPVVGYGFRDALWPDAPTVAMLDAVAPGRAVILVSADLHCAWLNTAALRLLGIGDRSDGLVREAEWWPVRDYVRGLDESQEDDAIADAAGAAAARGVVGIIEFETADNVTAWRRRAQAGTTSLRVVCAAWPEHLDLTIERGLRTGSVVLGTGGLVTMGPFKISLDGSLNTRTAFCHDPYPEGAAGGTVGPRHGVLLVEPGQLESLLLRATTHGLDCAVHAIGDAANTAALDAFERVGAHGSIEHAQLVVDADVARFAAAGVRASVQPAHLLTDHQVADRYWSGRTSRAFAYRSLLDAGADLLLGSDAPVSPLDPWATMAAAVDRSQAGEPPWHPEQALSVREALLASMPAGSGVRAGEIADLVVVDSDPLTCDGATLASMPVGGTMLAGRWTWQAW
jgi:predicted amidohydrolase YtcJ